MKLTVTSGFVPVGNYRAKLASAEQVHHEEFGPGVRYTFEVTKGPCAGQKVGRTTGLVASPRNAAGKFLGGMLGRDLAPGEEIDVDELVGREFFVIVAAAQAG